MRCLADLDAQCATRRRDAQVLISESADEIERLLRLLLLRETQRVRLDLRFHRGAHLWRCTEKPVGGDRTVDTLMRPLEVVVLDEQLDPAQSIREVGEHCLAQKLLPQRLPEPLDLAERLGMLRSALAVLDAAPAEQFLKLGLAAPRRVLPSLVCQHLARLAVIRNALLQRLDHQTRLLVMS